MLKGLAIMKVCYNDNTKRDSIKSVKAARFSSRDGKVVDMIGHIVSWSKEQIIAMITDTSEEARIFTATVEDDKYILGPGVEVCTHNDLKNLRIAGSMAAGDDLDQLPVYEAHC